jgi:hypothetical protein
MHRIRVLVLLALACVTCVTSKTQGAVIFDGSNPIFTIEEALKGRVTATPQGGKMDINLHVGGLLYHFPTISQVSISDLAHQFGFNHFNWINQIVGAPDQWQWYTGPTLTNHIDPPSQFNPFNDPATGSLANWTVVSGAQQSTIIPDPGVVNDTHPAYWNEAGYGGTPNSEWNSTDEILCDGGFAACGTHGGRHFLFSDAPSVGAGMYDPSLPNQHVLFQTSLAGIRDDGTYETWHGIGTTFYWKSDAVNVSDVLRLKAYNDVPQIVSGGVFDIVSDIIVPEPSTIALVAPFGLVAAAIAIYHQRQKSLRGENRTYLGRKKGHQ